ncbi:MAG: hypothetical protein HZB40_17915 [Rhodocyclales bacterium]|nr:hypothetical protein [Rhodocyclales bacterium]
MREAMRQALRGEAARIGTPDGENSGMADRKFAAMSALHRLDTASYVPGGSDEGDQPTVEYVPPADEAWLRAEL